MPFSHHLCLFTGKENNYFAASSELKFDDETESDEEETDPIEKSLAPKSSEVIEVETVGELPQEAPDKIESNETSSDYLTNNVSYFLQN